MVARLAKSVKQDLAEVSRESTRFLPRKALEERCLREPRWTHLPEKMLQNTWSGQSRTIHR